MKKLITFSNGRSALLHNGIQCAKLYVDGHKMPCELADALHGNHGIDVSSIDLDKVCYCICLWHSLSPDDLLFVVNEAIQQVYNTDTSVSNA